ncbi:winged helix-turn-helix domain-containing protein [Sinorhizobium sp. BG8]|uniref:winged helix-turn-helix domain-containing protein n=1 Tax=Sinorhizobium sp. BG8 TaxID=2613773 RepID=UPI00193D54BA|nr:winged helix-turn-helix domain-containing protein [Sinorhizobium sp. BG8]QRM56488.1 tetratricopeptide repeat protein [Sinorhizobium sp. BG8]
MADKVETCVFHIGDCVLDLGRGTLERCGIRVPIRAKTFSMLSHFALRRGQVLSKEELIAAVWPSIVVSDDSLTQCVHDLRKALGDDGQRLLQTVARRGYILATSAEGAVSSEVPHSAVAQAAPGCSAGEPRVAVLPFANAGNPEDAFFIDGIVEEITNGLSRFKTVTVLARNSVFALRSGSAPAPGRLGDELGADFVVEGSVRRYAGRVGVSAFLSETNGRRLWGETFSCSEEEIFETSDVIAYKIIARLMANIEGAVLRRPPAPAASSVEAFEQLTRGIALLRSYGEGVNEKARVHFLRAVELDPRYGLAHSYLSLADAIIGGYGGAPLDVLTACRERAATALIEAPEEGRCHRIMAQILLCLREYDAAEQHFRRSLDLNPYDADTLAQMAYLLTLRGRAQDARAWMERAIQLNPLHPLWYHLDRSMMLYMLGEYAEAAEALACIDYHGPIHRVRLAASYAMAGMEKKAADCLRRTLETFPELRPLEVMVTRLEFERREDSEQVLHGVRLAIECLEASAIEGPQTFRPGPEEQSS